MLEELAKELDKLPKPYCIVNIKKFENIFDMAKLRFLLRTSDVEDLEKLNLSVYYELYDESGGFIERFFVYYDIKIGEAYDQLFYPEPFIIEDSKLEYYIIKGGYVK